MRTCHATKGKQPCAIYRQSKQGDSQAVAYLCQIGFANFWIIGTVDQQCGLIQNAQSHMTHIADNGAGGPPEPRTTSNRCSAAILHAWSMA